MSCADVPVQLEYSYHFVNPGGQELSSRYIPLLWVHGVYVCLWGISSAWMLWDLTVFSRRIRIGSWQRVFADRPAWVAMLASILLTLLWHVCELGFLMYTSKRGKTIPVQVLVSTGFKVVSLGALVRFLLMVGKGYGFSRVSLYIREASAIRLITLVVVVGSFAWFWRLSVLSYLVMVLVWGGVARIVHQTAKRTQRFALALGLLRRSLLDAPSQRHGLAVNPRVPGTAEPGGQLQPSAAHSGTQAQHGRNEELTGGQPAAGGQRVLGASGTAAGARQQDAASFGTSPVLQLRQARFYWMFGGLSLLLCLNSLFATVWATTPYQADSEFWASSAITSAVQFLVFVRLMQMLRLNSTFDLYYDAQQYNLLLVLAPLLGPEAQWRLRNGTSGEPELGESEPSAPRAAPASFLQQLARTWRAVEFAPDGDAASYRLAGECALGARGLPPGTVAARRRVLVLHPDQSESLGTVAVVHAEEHAAGVHSSSTPIALDARAARDGFSAAVPASSHTVRSRDGYQLL